MNTGDILRKHAAGTVLARPGHNEQTTADAIMRRADGRAPAGAEPLPKKQTRLQERLDSVLEAEEALKEAVRQISMDGTGGPGTKVILAFGASDGPISHGQYEALVRHWPAQKAKWKYVPHEEDAQLAGTYRIASVEELRIAALEQRIKDLEAQVNPKLAQAAFDKMSHRVLAGQAEWNNDVSKYLATELLAGQNQQLGSLGKF